MMEPVACPSGHTFECDAIEEWLLLSNRTHPLTREPLMTLQVGAYTGRFWVSLVAINY